MFKPTIKGRDLRLNIMYIILCDLRTPTKKYHKKSSLPPFKHKLFSPLTDPADWQAITIMLRLLDICQMNDRIYLVQRSNFLQSIWPLDQDLLIIMISQECGLKQVIADTTLAVSSEMGAILFLSWWKNVYRTGSDIQLAVSKNWRKILSLNFVLVNVANRKRSHVEKGPKS